MHRLDGLYTPSWVLIEGKHITCVGSGDLPQDYDELLQIYAQGLDLLPGFINLHIYTSEGSAVMNCDPLAI